MTINAHTLPISIWSDVPSVSPHSSFYPVTTQSTAFVNYKTVELEDTLVIPIIYELPLTEQEFNNELGKFFNREIAYIKKRKKEIFGA